jgi:PPOX class probable F420-dependent enzyme
MVKLTPTAVKLIEGKNFANVATVMVDGSPHVTPVWIDHDGDIILVNSQGDRIKSKNLARDPRVALSIFDQSDPYNAVFIRGKVKEITKKGAEEHIDKMAKKYLGKEKYPWRQPGQPRILIRIQPLKVSR